MKDLFSHIWLSLDILQNVLADEKFKQILNTYMNSDATVNHLLKLL